jgi:TRAP-type C4-dicarboxylate transport system permease small subunit
MLKRLEALSRRIGVVEQAILVLCLTIMILFAFTQVVLRFLPGDWSVTWLEPVARQLVLWVGMLGASFATMEGRHISIEALPKLFNAKQKKWLGVFIQLIAAGLALVLGILAWTWLIQIDRQEISEAQEIAHAMRERADTYKGQDRSKIVQALEKEATSRVNALRLEGFARLIRFDRVTALKLSSLEASDYPYVTAAKILIGDDETLTGADLKAMASFDTVEKIAVKFDAAAAAYTKGDTAIIATLFKNQPADSNVAASVSDPVATELFEVAKEIQRKADKDPSELMRTKATLTLRMADQKAFLSLGGLYVHEWWFHVVIPLALFIMAFRFLINSLAAFILTPEEYEERAETLKKDIEAFEAAKRAELAAKALAASENSSKPVVVIPKPGQVKAAKPYDLDDDAPPGALETKDLPREGLFEDVDKAPPPRTRSGLVPKQEDDDGSMSEDYMDESEMDSSDKTLTETAPLENPEIGTSDDAGGAK